MRAGAARVRADPGKLHDVLRNLVGERDQVRAGADDDRIETAPADGSVAVIVSDEGREFPRGISRVFERFYRVDNRARATPAAQGLAWPS